MYFSYYAKCISLIMSYVFLLLCQMYLSYSDTSHSMQEFRSSVSVSKSSYIHKFSPNVFFMSTAFLTFSKRKYIIFVSQLKVRICYKSQFLILKMINFESILQLNRQKKSKALTNVHICIERLSHCCQTPELQNTNFD